VQELAIPARDGTALRARLLAPSTAPGLPVLLYLHGGGFTIGSIDTHDTLCRVLAAQSGAAVLALDYRLAPEHRFPPPCTTPGTPCNGWRARARALGLDAARIAVGGDSAGGTLAAVSSIQARDAGLPLALQLLVYPGTTAHQDTPSHAAHADGRCSTGCRSTGSCPVHRPGAARGLALCPAAGRRRGRRRPPGWAWPSATRWWTRA
jgi:acetyl esterase